ncbi:unnamed protein product [Arabis nemorensis]|uniref:Peptidase A1 domain-containing protein n=1 Tax=Arabis nemorensis TaxID=586526 RepID=A0A565CBN4_9BRAS|nr:unnamed protein product [Arabis nemorensis]
MGIYFTSLCLFLIILNFSIYVVLLLASPTLILNLIHANQIHSLKHPHVSRIEEASLAHLDYLQAKASGDIIAHLHPNIPTSFLVNISIGNPPIMQLLNMDTGSDLTWLQCTPCTNCLPQSIPFFDPSRSYTYRNEFDSCRTTKYSMPSLRFNAKTKFCEYSMKYMDGTWSRGTLVKETLTFNTIYGEFSSASLPNVAFGCGYDNYGEPQYVTGVLGLGYGRLSLLHRFGKKFSCCFGSLYDLSYPHNVLVIGDDGTDILGDTTPLEIENGLYYIGIEAISLGGIILPIDPWVFKRNYETGSRGAIIDTGTTLTYLMECYNGDIERDLVESGFPIVTFHFSDGAELSLDTKSVFTQMDIPGVFCLTVTPSTSGNLSIIGALAQQNYNVGYDLKAKKVSFENIDCGILFDY